MRISSSSMINVLKINIVLKGTCKNIKRFVQYKMIKKKQISNFGHKHKVISNKYIWCIDVLLIITFVLKEHMCLDNVDIVLKEHMCLDNVDIVLIFNRKSFC
jgi:hypothetical protein